jgi:TP901-1 family phage major tail protein
MSGQKGKDLVLKIDEGDGVVIVAGLQARRIAFSAEILDCTNTGSSGQWRELMSGGGCKRASIAGRGLFKDQSSDALLRQAFFDGALKNFQIVIPDFGTVTGAFQVVGLELAGEHIGEMTYDLALESAGALTFAAT